LRASVAPAATLRTVKPRPLAEVARKTVAFFLLTNVVPLAMLALLGHVGASTYQRFSSIFPGVPRSPDGEDKLSLVYEDAPGWCAGSSTVARLPA
jgi:hypothetical protein